MSEQQTYMQNRHMRVVVHNKARESRGEGAMHGTQVGHNKRTRRTEKENKDQTRTKKKKNHIVNQVEDGLDEDDEGPDLEGPAVDGDMANLVGWVAPEGVEACRRMTMRPSEWAEKIASTTTSSSDDFAVGRGRGCRWRSGTGAAV
jgi:hypothetical protein